MPSQDSESGPVSDITFKVDTGPFMCYLDVSVRL